MYGKVRVFRTHYINNKLLQNKLIIPLNWNQYFSSASLYAIEDAICKKINSFFLTVANSSSIQINRAAPKNYRINNIIVTLLINTKAKMVTHNFNNGYIYIAIDGRDDIPVYRFISYQINKQKSNANLNFFWFLTQSNCDSFKYIDYVCVKCIPFWRYDRLWSGWKTHTIDLRLVIDILWISAHTKTQNIYSGIILLIVNHMSAFIGQ